MRARERSEAQILTKYFIQFGLDSSILRLYCADVCSLFKCLLVFSFGTDFLLTTNLAKYSGRAPSTCLTVLARMQIGIQ